MKVVLEEELSAADGARYDAFVDQAESGHFSQTRAWAELASAGRSLASASLLVLDGDDVIGAAQVLRPRFGPIPAPFAMIERGPVCRTPHDLARVLPVLRNAARHRGIVRLAIMPYFGGSAKTATEDALLAQGFRSVQRPDGAHVRTLRFDLAGNADGDLFAGGEREALRRKLRQAEKCGARTRQGGPADVPILEALHAKMMQAQSRPKKSAVYFRALQDLLGASDRGALFLAEHDQTPIAAVFVMAHGGLVTFVIGATTTASRPFSKMAPPLAQAIRWAHARGATAFDLGGIPSEDDADARRAAIARFKFDFTKRTLHLTAEHARWF